MMKSILKLENLSKTYYTEVENIDILKNVNFEVFEGDYISIQGKSGSGKSTLLNILGLLDFKYTGNYYINNTDLVDENYNRAKNIGFVFQFHHLLDEFNVLENIMLPALNLGEKSEEEIRKEAIDLLEMINLKDRMHFYPKQLSGGEKQRVAIIRALINNPSIILADEPTGNLDYENSEIVKNLFIKLNKKYNQTIIIVTHSINLANSAKRKYVLKDRNLQQEYISSKINSKD